MSEVFILIGGLFAAGLVAAIFAMVNDATRSMRTELAPPREPLAKTLPFKAFQRVDFTTAQDQGNYGEALTFVAMAARGWRPVNGKLGGPHGIDGIFLRDTRAGWEAVLVETKTGSSHYKDSQMSDEKLLANLDTLYLTEGEEAVRLAYRLIADGLRNHDSHVRKELWRHDLDEGQTQAISLGRDGARLGRARLMDLHIIHEGLSAALREFDRNTVYHKRP